MGQRTTRTIAEKSFKEAGFFKATGKDIPGLSNGLTDGERHHLNVLKRCAEKLTVAELRALTNIFDGIGESGETLSS